MTAHESSAFSKPTAPNFNALLADDTRRPDQNSSLPAQVYHACISTYAVPVKEGLQAAAYSGIANPLMGAAQVGAQLPRCEFLKATPETLARVGLQAPVAPTNRLEGTAQKVGTTAGSILPYLALHQAVRMGAGRLLGEQAALQISELAVASKTNFARTLAREAGISFATGFIYDSGFKVSDPSLTGKKLAQTRLLDGISNGTTMAVLTSSSFGLGRVARSAAVNDTWIQTALTHPATGGVLSAIPAGLAQSEVSAVRKGKLLPTLPETKDTVYQMAGSGFLLGLAHAAGAQGKGLAPYEPAGRLKLAVQGEIKAADLNGATLESAAGLETPAPVSVQTKADAYRENPITDLESPKERAERLNLPKDMERSKAIVFGKAQLGDGTKSDVVIRPFASGAQSEMRVYRAGVSERVGQLIKQNTGVESSALPMVLRQSFALPEMKTENFDWTKTTTEPVIVQENGGKPLGMQLREWAIKAYGSDANGEPAVGSFTKLIAAPDGHVRSIMGRAIFDNMLKGNVDLVEFSQQTIPEGRNNAEINPSRDLHIVAIDNKNDFTNLPSPTWGFGSQFGMPLEVAKAFEGKSLAWADPALQSDAEKLLTYFTSETGKEQLVAAGLTPAEVEAAGSRLTSLTTQGFPPHLGETNYYGDEAKTQLTASLSSLYDKEAEDMEKYLGSRDQNLTAKIVDGKLVIVREDKK